MSDRAGQLEIEAGWEVRDVNGELVGTVIEATETYVLIEQGRFFPDDVYIPDDAVAGVQPGVVTLNVTGQAALDAGWHAGPPVGVGAFSTDNLAPAIIIAGQVDELGTTEDDIAGSQPAAAVGSVFQPNEAAYIERLTLGRLATVDADGEPHVVPVTHRFNRELESIDIGGHDFSRSKTHQNVTATGRVAYVVDDFDEYLVPRGIEIRGSGELLRDGGRELDPNFDDAMLRIYPEHIAHWGLTSDPA